MSNQNGLIGSTDVSANGNSESNFFIRKEDPIIINNLIATNITCDSIDINGGLVTTTAGGTVLELNGVPIGTGGLVDEIQANLPIVVTGTPQVPILSIANSGVTAGTYSFPTINVNSQGLVTSATNGIIPDNSDWSNFPAETNVNMANFLINNLGTPLVATDASTKGYVDTLDAQNVKITGAQNISGVKTFPTDLPQSVIVPTLPAQLVNKLYIDTLDGQNVKITGAQNITGIKTFTTDLPQSVIVPTIPAQLVNKAYVDGAIPGTPGLNNVLLVGNSAGSAQINMNNNKIVNCLNPTDPQDVATKDYVDTASVTPNLSAVLTAGNSAGSNDINMNGNDISSVNDITMSGLVPSITATNIAGNLVISSASSMNLATAGLLQVASGGVLSLGGASYTTLENIKIDNSTITKDGGADITFDDLTAINTTTTTTPLTIGCGTSINVQTNQYPVGLTVNDVINSGQPSTGILINNTLSTDDETNGLVVSSTNQSTSTSRNTNGVYINKLSTKNSPANAILIDNIEVSDNPGVASAINVGTVQAINDADIVGIQVSALNSAGGATTLMNCDNVNASGTAKGINLGLVNSSNKDAYGIVVDTVSGRDFAVGLQVTSVQAGPGNSECYGVFVNNVIAEIGDVHCIDSRGAVANDGNAVGVNVDTHQARNKVWGLSIDNLTSTSNDEVTGLYIGSNINTTGIARGIQQVGTPINILEGATTIGASSTATDIALTLGGSSVDKVQLFTGAGTIALNGGNVVSCAGSGPYTIQLPSNPLPGQTYRIVKSVNATVTISGTASGNNINNATTFAISGGQFQIATIIFINTTIDWVCTV